jgi:hypothetical protein
MDGYDRVAELRQHLGTGDPVLRVNGLGARGLRWTMTSLDEETCMVELESEEGDQRCRAHILDVAIAPLPQTAGRIRRRALRALRRAFVQGKPRAVIDHQGYVDPLWDNLLDGVHPELFEEELRRGDGNELIGKFGAVHSSAALAVNTFARWKPEPANLPLAGVTGFSRLGLEVQCTVVAGSRKANLDAVAEGPDAVVGVESKLLEPLSGKNAEFAERYDTLIARHRDSPWLQLVELLRASPKHFAYLDAAQLVKHSIGLRQRFPSGPISLLYLFWEPTNARSLEAYDRHRQEVEELQSRVAGDRVRLVAQSHLELWDDWSAQGTPGWLSAHVEALRQRYAVRV